MRIAKSHALVLTSAIVGPVAGCGRSADSSRPSARPSESLPSALTDTKPLTAVYQVSGPEKADMSYDIGSGPSARDNGAKLQRRKEVKVRDRRSAGLLSVTAMSFAAETPAREDQGLPAMPDVRSHSS